MLKRYGFATKPPTLPSGKTCILEMQITDFAFSAKNLLPESCVRRIDHRGWRCQAASLALEVMNATVHNPPSLAPPTLMPDHLSNYAGPLKQQLCCPGLEAPLAPG
jgi:hypothetical protein